MLCKLPLSLETDQGTLRVMQPFVDSDHFVHSYFPAREYAIIIPGIALAALVCFVLVFVGVVMVRSSQTKAKSKPKTIWKQVCGLSCSWHLLSLVNLFVWEALFVLVSRSFLNIYCDEKFCFSGEASNSWMLLPSMPYHASRGLFLIRFLGAVQNRRHSQTSPGATPREILLHIFAHRFYEHRYGGRHDHSLCKHFWELKSLANPR